MEVQGQRFNEPLDNWLKTMTASQQKLVKVGYKSLISWGLHADIIKIRIKASIENQNWWFNSIRRTTKQAQNGEK